MAIWQIENRDGTPRWRARLAGTAGKRLNATFESRADAELWVAKVKQQRAQVKAEQAGRNRSAEIDADLLMAAQQESTVGAMLKKAIELDWPDSVTQQKRGIRACRMVGFATPIVEVTTETLDEVVAALRAEGQETATIKIYLSALSVVLKRARRLKAIYELPLMPEGRTLKRAEPRDLVIQQDWFDYFLSCFEVDSWHRLTEFIWHVGCRVSEAQKLPWERINLSAGRIQFVKTKASMPRSLPISGDVERILLQCKRDRPDRGPFPKDYSSFREYYKERVRMTCNHFGLGEDIYEQWVIHTLRHTKLTRLANAGANAVQIKEWAGHHSLAVSQRYIHSSGIDLESLISVERRQTSLSWGIEGQFTR